MKKLFLLMVGVLFLGFATSCKKTKTENPAPVLAPASHTLTAEFKTSNVNDHNYLACICINSVNYGKYYYHHIFADTTVINIPANSNDSVDVQIISGVAFGNDTVTVRLTDGATTIVKSNIGQMSTVSSTINYIVP